MTKHKLNVNLALVFDTDKERATASDAIVAVVDGLNESVKEKAIIVKTDTEEKTVQEVTAGTREQVYPVIVEDEEKE